MKPKFYRKRVETEIKKTFPNSEMIKYTKFSKGLVSPTYKVKIKNPKRTLVVKIYSIKNKSDIGKNSKILKYLDSKKIPVPQIYSNTAFKDQGILIMNYVKGENAIELYNKSTDKVKRKILFNHGKLLKKIHSLKHGDLCIHNKHDATNIKLWIKWTRSRAKKYLNFAKNNFAKKYYRFLKNELSEFLKLLNEDSNFVPLHWDYHLANLIVTKKGKIAAILDFDQAMKGENFSDIGISKYFLRFDSDDSENFKYFLKGYGVNSKTHEELINGYFLLHLMAVTRSLWTKKKYSWIINKHYMMLDEIM